MLIDKIKGKTESKIIEVRVVSGLVEMVNDIVIEMLGKDPNGNSNYNGVSIGVTNDIGKYGLELPYQLSNAEKKQLLDSQLIYKRTKTLESNGEKSKLIIDYDLKYRKGDLDVWCMMEIDRIL